MTDQLKSRQTNPALLEYLAERAGCADWIEYVEALLASIAERGEPAQTLAALIERDARRLQTYWRQVIDTGQTAMGRQLTPKRLAEFRQWHREITDLLGGESA